MTETLAQPRPQIDEPAELDRVVRRLVEAVEPVAIYLFGSRARGDAAVDSDYDLMIVLADDSPLQSRQPVWDAARSRQIDCSPFLTRASSFAWRRHQVGTLEYEVEIDGIQLYSLSGPDFRSVAGRGNRKTSMNAHVVGEWLERVRRDLVVARRCCEGQDPLPDQAAYHVQQAAEKLTKGALVACELRPRKGHMIGEFAAQLPDDFPLSGRFRTLDRFTRFVSAFRYPDEGGAPPEPMPAVGEVAGWIAEMEGLKADFERWLAEREATA